MPNAKNVARGCCLLPLILCCVSAHSQNLLVNAGAELPPVGNGWTQVSGDWQQRTADPAPHEGNAYFFAGANAQAELYQDVAVSAYAANIDASTAYFTFTGFVRSWPQSPPDQSQEIVEYRDAIGTVLTSFTSAWYDNTSQWVKIVNTTRAPVGTRIIRVRLLANRQAGSNNDGYHDSLSLTMSTEAPLPLKLLSFSAQQIGRQDQLMWQTTDEINTSAFNIQQSTDGDLFQTVATVAAAGVGSEVHQYQYLQNLTNAAARRYYRLRMEDHDGRFFYSKIVAIETAATKLLIWPNPATSTLFINGNRLRELQLVSSDGKLLLRHSIGRNGQLDVSRLAKGLYYIVVVDERGNTRKEKVSIR